MKRCILAALVMLLLLSGCAQAEPVSGISVRAASEYTDFGSFSAGAPEPGDAEAAEMLVREVLALYPAGLSDQWGEVEILLVAELTGEEAFAHGSYAGFTLRQGDGWLMVLDVRACDAGTVHHEIAHILDGILTDAGALSESEWMALCPGSFAYGEGDFERYPDFFADAYAMENIREDRARTFEEALRQGPGAYADRPALWLKLEYFSRAIRSHFDTEGWPDKTVWELALG